MQLRDGAGHRRVLAFKAREMRGAFLRVRVEEYLYVMIRERREQVLLARGEREVEAAIYPPEADGDAPSRRSARGREQQDEAFHSGIVGSAIVRRKTMDPRGVLSSRISFDCFAALRVSLISIARLTAFIRLANMSSKSMMMV